MIDNPMTEIRNTRNIWLRLLSPKHIIIILIILIVILVFLYFLFIFDIGINSKYFITRDFNQAFTYRQTGNCEAFKEYINQDVDSWVSRCYSEKRRLDSKFPISKFSINNITISGNVAYLSVQLNREVATEKAEYAVTYQMIKKNSLPYTRWMIDQELDK